MSIASSYKQRQQHKYSKEQKTSYYSTTQYVNMQLLISETKKPLNKK